MTTSITSSLSAANYEALDKIVLDVENTNLKKNQELGQDAFLKLMMTQLANQDPLSPMDNEAMIAQMAQFSSVEQLGNIGDYIEQGNVKSDNMIEILQSMQSGMSSVETNAKMDDLIIKTDRSNELNIEILNELIALNKTLGAYEE